MTTDTLSKKFDVVAVYDLYNDEEVKLAAARDVLQGLNAGGNRDAYFMKRLAEELETGSPLLKFPAVLSLLTGANKTGLRMTAVQANHNGLPAYLALVEDTKNGQLLVVGPPGLAGTGDAAGVTYVDSGARDAAEKANDFLSRALKTRGEKDELSYRDVPQLIESMVQATSVMGRLKNIFQDNSIPAETTVGQCLVEIARGGADMAAYTLAGQKTATPKA